MATLDVNGWPKPELVDVDNTLVQEFFAAETKLWLKSIRNSGVANGFASGVVRESETSEIDFPTTDVASTLLRHGKQLQDIHKFFQKLIPRRYLMTLACHMEPDHFQVVEHSYRVPYKGTQAITVSYKESEKPLHPEEYKIYQCALLAAEYPVLAQSLDPLPSSAQGDVSHQMNLSHQQKSKHDDPRLTPASKECMLYDKDPISPTSVFPIDSDVLAELVRRAFCLTQRRQNIYTTFIEKAVKNDPAKVLLEEMRELLAILNSDCHPYYQRNIFHHRDDYHKWLETEKYEIEEIVRKQSKLVRSPPASHVTIPLNFKDKHSWYDSLLVKLFKLESVHSQLNVATNEAIPAKPLSAESSRLLLEFGERYRIGDLYRRISLLGYLARNFDTKEWYSKYIMAVLESILQCEKSSGCLITREEVDKMRNAVLYLHAQVENCLSRINRLFPRNSPEGGLRAVIGVLKLLVVVDQDEIFGNQSRTSVRDYLKKYAKDEMRTNYDRQKIIYADQLKIRTFGKQSTPRMINLMILDISEKLRNYRMYFKEEFIGYFDIVEMGVAVFYGMLMEDVLELCDTYPVNRQPKEIDYPMIALAYRLSSFDQDPAWEYYLSLEKQMWREPFLKHSLSWMNSLHSKLHEFVSKALQQDTWAGVCDEDNTDSADSVTSRESVRRTLARTIVTPLKVSSVTETRPVVSRPTPSITPSFNSAFVKVGSRSASTTEKVLDNSTPQRDASTAETQSQSSVVINTDKHRSGLTADTDCGMSSKTDPSEGTITKETFAETLDSETKRGSAFVPIGKSSSSTSPQNQAVNSPCSSSLSSPCQSSVSLPHSSSVSFPHRSQTLPGSADSESSESSSVYVDARSHASDLDDVSDSTDAPYESAIGYHKNTIVPISSSLIDSIGGINRVVAVVCHISQLLCPKHLTRAHDSLRLSPEDRGEMVARLDAARVNLAKKMGDMLCSVAIYYGYYVISAESCGIDDDTLESIIGQRCLIRSLSQLQESGVRPCRHNTAGQERCNTVKSQGNCVTPCFAMCRVENSATQCEKVVNEMCVRINNLRTLKSLLPSLVKTAVQTVVDPGFRPDIEQDVMSMNEVPNILSDSCQAGTSTSSVSVDGDQATNVFDQNTIEKTMEELQEIEQGLVKLMAYRANAIIKKLLQLLLTLNLKSFNCRKRLQPVLNTTKRTLNTLAGNLYHDCYVSVLRHFWLAIVKDFEVEKDNLVFLSATARDQANLLLEAISYFIEIFRAEGEAVSLSFVSSSIEPVLQSLNCYILRTSSLVEMYEGLQMRNDDAVRMAENATTRHRYQRQPSDILVGRLRIELHSEHEYFSGRRFVQCVADQIRYEGNLRLGICAVPGGSDEDSAVTLGQYLLENGIIRCYGKIVVKATENADEENDLDEELESYARSGSTLFIPGKRTPSAFLNYIPNYNSSFDTASIHGSYTPTNITMCEDLEQLPCFSNSTTILYKFESTDVEESLNGANRQYHVTADSNNRRQDDIIRVLFTRRNLEREAKEFLAGLEPNDTLEELKNIIRNNSISSCRSHATPA